MKISPKLSGEINLPRTYSEETIHQILADLICGCDAEGCPDCREFFRVQDILRPEPSVEENPLPDHHDPKHEAWMKEWENGEIYAGSHT